MTLVTAHVRENSQGPSDAAAGFSTAVSTPSKEQRIADLQAAIHIYVGNITLSDALDRTELAQLEGIQRHLALSKSLIPAVIRICRLHKGESCRTAVFAIIALLCDNNDGLCRLSARRLAQLLGRTERNIRAAIDSLEADGALNVNRPNGLPMSYWPAVPRAIATMNPAMVWFVDALSDKPAPRGRPSSPDTKADENPGRSRPPFNEKTPVEADRPFPEKPRSSVAKTPVVSQHSISLRNITPPITTVGEEEREVRRESSPSAHPLSQKHDLNREAVELEPVDEDRSPKASVRGAEKAQEPARDPRGTRLAADWSLMPEARQWTREVWGLSDLQVTKIERAFKNYWLSRGGKDARKVDWGRTWVNWVDRDHTRVGETGVAAGTGSSRGRPSMDDIADTAFRSGATR